ncbi:hypothetical protein Q5692_31735 [Microcoleus sp. C2C3]|uniref:hypothetical protein n=1 Tax=unclassified Microcoleus TaxID=2642155 RepID=UPI002FD5DC2E
MKNNVYLLILILLTACQNQEAKPVALLAENKALAAEIIAPPALPKTKLHKINLAVTEPSDLKIKAGSVVSAGQIIADQEREKARLNQKKEELTLAVKRLELQVITRPEKPLEPVPPKAVPPLKELGDISYQQYEAAIEKAKKELERASAELSLKDRQIDYIKGIEGIDPAIIEHELAASAQLEAKAKDAAIEIELAQGKLISAKEDRQQKEYQHSLDVAKRIEEANTAQSFYQRQVAENLIAYQRQSADYEKEQRERDYRLTQTRLQLSAIDDSISKLSVIRSPYDGTVRRIKFTGQIDNKLGVDISLVVSLDVDRPTANPSTSSAPNSSTNSNTTNTTTF